MAIARPRPAVASVALLLAFSAVATACQDQSEPGRATTDSASCGGESPAKPDGTEWTCSFSDDFDGSSLDLDKWLVQETSYSGMFSGNYGCYVNDDDTIAVADGTLRLTARLGLDPFTCASPSGDYTSTATVATVATRGHFTQTYGRFAVRMRFPPGVASGPHAAAWLYPEELTYGPWPASGEVDIAEWFASRPENIYPSVHYAGEDPTKSSGYECPVPTASTEFHEYVLEWTPTVMRFVYDGELCHEHAWTPAAPLVPPQPFDQPFNIVLTQAWGSEWNAVTPETPDSATLEVDWVRAWK